MYEYSIGISTYDQLPAVYGEEKKPRRYSETTARAFAGLAIRESGGNVRLFNFDDIPRVLFQASETVYQSWFERDDIEAFTLADDTLSLGDQVAYGYYTLGKEFDPLTGQEPGGGAHEVPGFVLSGGRTTEYNACDTTAHLLWGTARLYAKGDVDILERYKEPIDLAIGYILRHVGDDNLFYEFNSHGVNYWEDSEFNVPENGQPIQPTVYTLAHFQNASALRAIGNLRRDPELVRIANDMTIAGTRQLWRGDHFVTALDGKNEDGSYVREIDSPSINSLYSLFFIPPELLPDGYAHKIQAYMKQLETVAGYRNALPMHSRDPYHIEYLWPQANAFMHAAAVQYDLSDAEEIAMRPSDYVGEEHEFPETLDTRANFVPGNETRSQLWVIGTHEYYLRAKENPKMAAASVLPTYQSIEC